MSANWYWTSSEASDNSACRVDFGSSSTNSDGQFENHLKTNNHCVRAVRSFTYADEHTEQTVSYTWSTGDTTQNISVSPTQTTTYTVTVSTSGGCADTVAHTIVVNSPEPQTFYGEVCQGEPYVDNGFVVTSAETSQPGIISRTRTEEVNGCETTHTLELTVKASPHIDIEETACGSYEWNGQTYTQSGDYTETYPLSSGCDSVMTLHLTVNHGTHNMLDTAVCESYEWHGTIYTISGTYTYDYTNTDGCASTDTLHLIVNHGTHNMLDTAVCESYEWHGTIYVISGTYTYDYTNTDGCASTDTLHLTVNHSTHNALDTTVCESYEWHGTTYTTSGTYTYDYTNTDDCASTDTLHLTINHPQHQSETVTAYDSYTWHGQAYTQSGDYTFAHEDGNGCVQVDTLHLTIHYSSSAEFSAVACESYTWNDSVYTVSGDYIQSFHDIFGADSVMTLHLTIITMPTLTHTPDTTILAGTSATLWASGADILYWTNGNDSILSNGNLLTVSPTTTTTYYLGGQNLNSNINDNLVENGDFEAGNVGFGTDYQYIVGNNMYFGRYSVTSDGILVWGEDHLYGYGGTGQFMVVDGATSPNSVIWQQTVPVTPNTYYAFSAQIASTLMSNMANSYALLQFSINNVQLGEIFHSPDVLNVWQPYYEVWYSGNNTSAILTILNQNDNGEGNDFGIDDITFSPLTECSVTDSIVVTVMPLCDTIYLTETACDSYLWYGDTLTQSGEYTHTLTNALGCDSVKVLSLTVNHPTDSTLEVLVLDSSLPFLLNGESYDTAGIYTQTLTNAAGCDSILTINMSVIPTILPDNIDSADCVFFPEGTEWGIEVGWSSANIVSNLNIPLVGDLDGDSHPEIICFSRNGDSPNAPNTNNQILVFDGVTKQLKTTITMASPVTAYDAAAYGMVKLPSGKGLIVTACYDLKLRAYDITASDPNMPFWTSDVDFGSNHGDWGVNVNFADFNNDGHPEVYVRNKIYNAETGVLLGVASGGNNTGSSFAHYSHYTNWQLSSPLAVNICNDSRSELVLGNEIYDVNITNLNGTNGNTISLERQITPPNSIVPDGHAQVADFNLDGHLDLFISSRSIAGYWGEVSFYVWDVHNNVLSSPMTISTIMSGKSIPLIADIDNDGLLEVLIQCDVNGSNEKIRAYKYDYATSAFSFMWGLAPDEDSYSNAITAFDFNQDGLLELMICDQSTVRIVNGSGHSHITGNDTIPMYVMSSFPFSEITIMQYPIIVDVDADGNAEIVSVGSDKLNIFESTRLPWAPARKVWNQYMYNVTNVNEDLTIPQYLFNNATVFTDPQNVVRRPFNNFLQQATSIDQYGRPFYAVPDVAVTGATVQADRDSITLNITYCNQGDNVLNAPYPVAVFANAYGGDTICSVTIAQSLPADSCTQGNIRLPFSMLCSLSALDSLVIAVNCSGGPLAQNGGLQPECDTNNNIVAVSCTLHADSTSITEVSCNSYRWNDSTYTQSGEYVQHFTNRFGCDSVVTLNLTVNQQVTVWDTLRLLRSSLPYTFAAADTILSAGTPDSSNFIWHIPAANGCDTIVMQTVFLYDDMTASVSGTINTDCMGRNCFYNGPTIMINEVMLSPTEHDGSIAGNRPSSDDMGEWIELYNPHKCDSVDISCYFLGNNAYDNGNYGGGFVLPQGTVVPPQGFCLVRGVNAPAVPSNKLVANGGNVVEVVVNDRYCWSSGGQRLWFPNAGGWFAFYDASGVPQDAICWCDSNYSCRSCEPCLPSTECGFQGSLASYNNIPQARKNYITSLNPNNFLGQTLRRIPDGGTWQSSPAAPTYAGCNSECVPPAESTCNAIAVASVSGGAPPYTYLWNDPNNQTTDTAFNLCAGQYTVTVTDAIGNTITASVSIHDFAPTVSHNNATFCLSDSIGILQGFPAGGSYTGGTIVNDTLFFEENVSQYQMAYTYADTNGCSATTSFEVTVIQNFAETVDTTLCSNELPLLWNGLSIQEAGTQHATLASSSGCDSVVTLNLTVNSAYNVSDTRTVCPSALPYVWNGVTFTEAGTQSVTLTAANSCDSVVAMTLTVNSAYNVTDTRTVCPSTLPYVWNGVTFNEAGTQSVTLTAANGCDSVVAMTLIINSETYGVLDITVNENDMPVTINDETYNEEGTYTQTLTNAAGCDSLLTINLVVQVNPTVTVDSTICISDLPIQWNGVTFTGAGTQTVTLTMVGGGDSTVVMNLHCINNTLEVIMLTEDPCVDMSANILAISEMTNFVWSTGETTPEIIVHNPGSYYVTATEGSCSATDHYYVPKCEFHLNLPNAITPGDLNGRNDCFSLSEYHQSLIEEFQILIYNRWGQLVFKSNDKSFRWYGEFHGSIVRNNTYNYIIHCIDINGAPHHLKGVITVL